MIVFLVYIAIFILHFNCKSENKWEKFQYDENTIDSYSICVLRLNCTQLYAEGFLSSLSSQNHII